MNCILTGRTDLDETTNYSHLLPEGAYKKVRRVKIYYADCIVGFRFFDSNDTLLFKIGWSDSGWKFTTVIIADNEVIVGVVANLYLDYQSRYTDF